MLLKQTLELSDRVEPSIHIHSKTRKKLSLSLPLKLLMLTLAFVMLAEVLIFLPSIGREQQDYLNTRLSAGHLSVLALEASPSGMVSDELRDELLDHANAALVGLKQTDGANLMLMSDAFEPSGSMIGRMIDLRSANVIQLIRQAFTTLFRGQEVDLLRVVGMSPKDPQVRVELVTPEQPLINHLRGYAWRVFTLSMFISFVTAGLIYLSLLWFLVRPVNRLTRSMARFAQSPETEILDLPARLSNDELGSAQRELNAMQDTVRTAFKERARLAALGTAVTKINHDLRNVLGTSLLLSDSLETSPDPMVKKVAPRLVREIERAADLCTATLKFAREEAPELQKTKFLVTDLFDDLEERLLSRADFDASIKNNLDPSLAFYADRDQVDRLFSNLLLNAAQAGATKLHISQHDQGLIVADNGPGLPKVTKDNLFQPFSATSKKDGSGLGLSIARDIMRAHGGDIKLRKSDETGTSFALSFDRETLS